MAAVGNIRKTTPAVGNFLVLGKCIGDQREDAQVFAKGLGKGLRRLFADSTIGVLKQIKRLLNRQFFAINIKTQARHGFIEQTVPGAVPGDRLFMEQLLELVFQLIRLIKTQIFQPWTVMTDCRIGGHRLF